MRKERQIELLQRVAEAGPHLRGLHGAASMTNPATAYTDPDAVRSASSGCCSGRARCSSASAASWRSRARTAPPRFGGVPVLVVRQPDGTLRAMVNACRHRGAPLLEPDTAGAGLRALSCPYHAWTYDLDGALRARPMSEGAFDDVVIECDLHPLAVAERYGMIFVRAGGTEPIDVDAYLGGAQDDLGAFQLDRYVHIESRTNAGG